MKKKDPGAMGTAVSGYIYEESMLCVIIRFYQFLMKVYNW